jgi:plasmid segregation protein ParM
VHPHRPAVLRGRAGRELAADTFRAKQLHDEYTETPEYMALLRGALSMMKVSHIDLLVVGLPVALFAVKKAALEKAMTGRHDIGGGKVVTVGKAMAVPSRRGRWCTTPPSTRRWRSSATSRA